jgi:hypothetical protein
MIGCVGFGKSSNGHAIFWVCFGKVVYEQSRSAEGPNGKQL